MHLADNELTNERTRLEAWRLQQLIDAGWKTHRATQLAERLDIDTHQANTLLKNGCDQKTALKILL